MEEYGHYLDSQLNTTDTPGDEGAIFAALVQGEELSEGELQQLKDEDDSAVVVLDGEEVAIEQSSEGTTTRVSIASDGSEANAQSVWARISNDGRYVVFNSSASNLVDNDTNNENDIFLYDRNTGKIERINISSDGSQANSSSINYPIGSPISADGRYVIFESEANNLVENDTNNQNDIFIRDRQTGSTERVIDLDFNNSEDDGNSYSPSISADGRYIVFNSSASNLVQGDTNNNRDVFVHDRQTGNTERISIRSNGSQANNNSFYGTISNDGRYVAFSSWASNLVANDTNNTRDIFVHDRQSGNTERVSVSSDGVQANGDTYHSAISADGRYVAFNSFANNLVEGDTNNHKDIFVHDRQTGKTERVNVGTDNSQANEDSALGTISADGRYVVFESVANNLVENDINNQNDIFVRDRQTGKTERVNLDSAGSQTNNRSFLSSISADGQYVAFNSWANNLVDDDNNSILDIFVRDRGESFSNSDNESDTTLFFEDFETDLSQWTGKQREFSSGIIVDDPLESDRALSFTEFGNGGDIFSLEAFEHPSAKYRLSFDYLAVPVEGSIEDNMGGFAGYTYDLNDTNNSQWLIGTTTNSLNLRPNFQEIDALEQWESIAVEYTEADSFHLAFEDFVASQGIAGDVYFDNIRLEAIPTSNINIFPDDVTALISTLDGKVGTVDSLGEFSQITNGVELYDIALSDNGRLYGITSGSSSRLYEINLNSGEFSLIGSSGADLNALTFDDSNTIYGAGGSNLYTVDANTGIATESAYLGSDFKSSGDIVFDSSTNKFFATSTNGSDNALYSVSKSGEVIEIGNIGFDDVWGLSIENGNLIGFTADKERILINKQTGTGTFDANINGINGQVSGAASIRSSNVNNGDTDDNNNDDEDESNQGNSTPPISVYETLAKDGDYVYNKEIDKSDDLYINQEVINNFAELGYTLDEKNVFQDGSGFYAVGLTSDKYSPVLVIRGTESNTFEDIFTDLDPDVIGEDQFKSDAANEAKEWLRQQNNPDIIGHSLGGALAQMFVAELTSEGTKINNLFTFNSPGISKDYVDLSDPNNDIYDPNNIENVHHYIVSGDPVTLGGDEFLDDNDEEDDVTVFSYSDILSSIKFDKHLEEIVDKNNVKGNPVSKKNISVEELSRDSFSYFPDPDYLALQFLVSGVGIELGNSSADVNLGFALRNRGSVEQFRAELGSYAHDSLEQFKNGEKVEIPNLEFAIAKFDTGIDNFALFTDLQVTDSLFSITSEDLSVQKIGDEFSGEEYLEIQGKATAQLNLLAKKPIKGTANFTEDSSNINSDVEHFIRLGEQDIHLVGEVELNDFPLGLVSINSAKLFFDLSMDFSQTDFQWKFDEWKMDMMVGLPGGISVGGGIGFVDGSPHPDYMSLSGGSEDIPIIDFSVSAVPLGIFLDKIEGSIDNLQSEDLNELTIGASGTLSLKPVIPGQQIGLKIYNPGSFFEFQPSALIKLDAGITMTPNLIKVDTQAVTGAGVEGRINLFAELMKGEAKGEIDRNKEHFKLEVNLDFLNNYIEIDGDLAVNYYDGFTIAAKGEGQSSVKIPGYIDDLGHSASTFNFAKFANTLLSQNIGTAFYYNFNQDSNGENIAWDDYVAGWGKPWWFPKTIGFKFKFDGDIECLGFEEVESIKDQIDDVINGESSTSSKVFLASGLLSNDLVFQNLVDLALTNSQSVLTKFASMENVNNLLSNAFGDSWNESIANNIIENWQVEIFDNLPIISLVNSASLDGANGAFADSTNTIYISREYLAYQQDNPEAVSEVLLEEIGHWLDSQINDTDAAGDEGDIFSKLVRNEIISNEQLQQLQAEDDTVVINLNGTETELNLSTSVEDSFFVGEDTPWFSMAANWKNDSNNVEIELVSPNGTVYTEADIANSDSINIVEELSDSTHRIVYIDNPDAGSWTIKVLDPSNLGNVELGAIGGTNPGSIEVTSLVQTTEDSTVVINYEAFDIDSDAKVSFFYDENGEGFDGYLISDTATEKDGIGSFAWNTEGVATGDYYIYAMIADDNSVPVYDYFEQSISITEEADLSIEQTTNLDSVIAGEDVTYKVIVTNNGDTTSKGVTVTETLPESATFSSATIDVLEQAEDYIRFNLGDLAAGASTEFEIVATMPDALGQVSSRASVDARTFDPDVTNDIAVVDVTVEESELDVDDEPEVIDVPDLEEDVIEPRLLLTQVHRFYQYENGYHLYTADDNEINYVKEQSDAGNLSYSYEGEKYQVLADNVNLVTGEEIEGVEPIYRFFNTQTGAHLYTMNEVERGYIQDNLDNYSFEGVKYYAFETEPQEIETIPVYRMYNSQSGAHLYSSDQNEINYIQENLPHFSMENNGDAAFHVLEL